MQPEANLARRLKEIGVPGNLIMLPMRVIDQIVKIEEFLPPKLAQRLRQVRCMRAVVRRCSRVRINMLHVFAVQRILQV